MRKLDGTRPDASPECTPSVRNFDLEHAAGHAAQAVGEPKLVVVASARVQAHHQADIAQAGLGGIDVVQQVVGAAFLASLDQADDARVRHILGFQGLDGRNGGVGGIAVVRTATSVELAVVDLGCPRAQVAAPAGELGLLVQMAVHQHGGLDPHAPRPAWFAAPKGALGGRPRSGHPKEQHRCATRQAHHFQFQTGDLLRLDPGGGVAHHGVEVAVGSQSASNMGTWRGCECSPAVGDDLGIPRLAHLRKGRRSIKKPSTVIGRSWWSPLGGLARHHATPRAPCGTMGYRSSESTVLSFTSSITT